MARQEAKLLKNIVLSVIIVAGWLTIESLYAATYEIGTGKQYESLHALRTAVTGLVEGDVLVFFDAVDDSWDQSSYFNVSGNVEIKSSVVGESRTISSSGNTTSRLFDVSNGSLTISDDFIFSGFQSSASGTMSASSGGTLNVEGVLFENNRSISFGGAIDTYSGVNLINAKGAIFRNNTGSRGGGVEVYYSKEADFTDATFINNQALNEPGGAIIIMGNSGGKTTVTLGASDGNVSLFEGNKFIDPYTLVEQANSVYVQYDGTYDINIVTTGTGELQMLDPIYLTPGYNYTATFTKTGTGTWILGGDNQINTGSGKASFVIQEGVFQLNKETEIHMTGANDSLSVKSGATTYIYGDNTIKGTTVTFEPGAYLTFDMSFFNGMTDPEKLSTPMLFLDGNTLAVAGTTIKAENLAANPNGDYLLIRGDKPLLAGDFRLFLDDDTEVDVSGNRSRRFGYALDNTDKEEELILHIQDFENAIVQWKNNDDNKYANQWSIYGKNWTLPYRTEPDEDGFVTGDTVVFDNYGTATGTQTITLINRDNEKVVIGPNADGGYTYYLDNGIGMHVTGDLDWVFNGYSISDAYDGTAATADRIAALLFDGSGTLRLNNTNGNSYHGGTILAGTGTLFVRNMNQIGSGTIRFWDNNDAAKASRLEFSDSITLERQLLVEKNANGLVTSSQGKILTVNNQTSETYGSAALITGGKLTFQGVAGPESLIVKNNVSIMDGGAVHVQADGTSKGVFQALQTTFQDNEAYGSGGAVYATDGEIRFENSILKGNQAGQDGGAIYSINGDVIIKDSTFEDNVADSGNGGAVYFDGTNGSTLRLEATASGQTVFRGNTASGLANSIYMVGGKMIVDVEKGDGQTTGLVYTEDPFAGTETQVEKTGAGVWRINGENSLTGTNAQLTIKAGTLEMVGDKDASTVVSSLGIDDGKFSLESGGVLLVNGGNQITANSIAVGENATFAFNMKDVQSDNNHLLDIQATNWSETDWTKTVYIDLRDLTNPIIEDENETRRYDIMAINDSRIVNGIQQKTLVAQYDGTDISKLRMNSSQFVYQNGILSIDMTAPQNGLTVWNSTANGGFWNQELLNWKGTNEGDFDITGTEKFLGGDAVRFEDKGAGTIQIRGEGVRVADQQNGKAGFTVNNSQGNDYIFTGGSIRGDARFIKTGNGNVLFANSNDFTGGSSIQGGTVTAQKISSLGTGDIEVRSGATGTTLVFDLALADSGELTQSLKGDGTLRKEGQGSLKIAESNKGFTGNAEIRGGKLIFGAIDALGSTTIDTGVGTSNGTLVLENVAGSFGKNITGTGSLLATGSETKVKLTQTNTYSGGTGIDSGAEIEISKLGNLGSGNIRVDGTLTMQFSQSETFDDNRTITGTGNIIKNGSGTLSIENELPFSGTFQLNSGNLALGNGYVLKNATFDYRGGNFDYQGGLNLEFGALAGGTSSSGRRLDLLLQNDRNLGVTMTIGGNNTDQTFSGTISGKGNVVKIGSGEQVFEGKNTYEGGTLISGGKLTGTDVESFGLGQIVNNGELEFRINDSSGQVYDKTIEGTGLLTKSGSGDLTLKGEQKYQGGTIVDEGSLIVNSVKSVGMNLDSQNSGSLQIRDKAYFVVDIDAATNDAADTTLNGKLTGSGTLVKQGDGVFSISSAKDFKGHIDHEAGTLFIDGNVAASVDVYKNATLSGWGNVDNSVRFKDGSIHRVNSRSVSGLGVFEAKNIVYEGGSTIYIKVGPNGTDQVVADDTINFAKGGGTVNVRFINLGMNEKSKTETDEKQSYEIFSSQAGILELNGRKLADGQGVFKDVVLPGVDGRVNFLADDVEGINIMGYSVQSTGGTSKGLFVDLSLIGSGTSGSYLNQNQLNTLGGIANAGVYDQIYERNQSARGSLIDQMMPMIYTAMPYLTNRAVTQFNAGTFERLRFLRDPIHIAACPVEGRIDPLYRDRGKPSYRCSELDIWFQNYGDFILMQANGDTPEFRADSYGFNLGLDTGVTRYSALGIGFGGYFSDVNASKIYQKAEIESGLISVYGDWANESGWMMTASGGFVYSRYKIDRNVYDCGSRLSSKHNGLSTFLSLEGSKKFLLGRYELTPFVGVDVIWVHEQGHQERAIGDPSLALRVKSNNTNSILSTMGVRFGRCFRMLGGNIVNPSVYAAWVHNYNVGQVVNSAAFYGGDDFSIWGASMYRDRAKVGTNINMTLNHRMDMFTRFDAELGDHMSDISVHLGFRLGF